MDLDYLIRKLRDWAEIMSGTIYVGIDTNDLVDTLNKAAEVIKLQRECISEESNEHFKRGLDSVL